MTIEQRATLGDKEAQRQITERGELLPCPRCHGEDLTITGDGQNIYDPGTLGYVESVPNTYAYPPAHIDREAWEPCECCKPSCKTCANAYAWDTHGKPDVCKKCLCFANFVADDNFCEKCGRPRTEEAWAMLEKRLRG